MPRTSFTAKLNSSVHIRSVIKRMTYSASLGEIFIYRKKKTKELSKQEDKLKQRQRGKKKATETMTYQDRVRNKCKQPV